VRGRVTGVGPDRIRGFDVSVLVPGIGDWGIDAATFETVGVGPDGEFEIGGLWRGAVLLVVRGPGKVPVSLKVEAPADDVVLAVPASGVLRGRLDADHRPLGLVLLLERTDAGADALPTDPVQVGYDGEFESGPLEVGRYRVRVAGMGVEGTTDLPEILIRDGEVTTVEWRLPARTNR
jgi:hypothetical protein